MLITYSMPAQPASPVWLFVGVWALKTGQDRYMVE